MDLTYRFSHGLNCDPMDLSTYISDADRAQKLAARLGTSTGWLWQIANRWRGKKASAELATRIERETATLGPEAVPRASLRPDLFFTVPGLVAANDDVGPLAEENCDGIAATSVDVEGTQGGKRQVHGAASSAKPTAAATMIGGTNPGGAR